MLAALQIKTRQPRPPRNSGNGAKTAARFSIWSAASIAALVFLFSEPAHRRKANGKRRCSPHSKSKPVSLDRRATAGMEQRPPRDFPFGVRRASPLWFFFFLSQHTEEKQMESGDARRTPNGNPSASTAAQQREWSKDRRAIFHLECGEHRRFGFSFF